MKSIQYIASVLILAIGIVSCARNYDLSYVDGFNPTGGDSVGMDVDTSSALVDRSKYGSARIYPGLVDLDVPRLDNVTAEIDVSVLPQPASVYRISVSQIPAFSIGYYAPAGELIKITVPEGKYGLYAQIGVHTDNLSAVEAARRDPLIFTRKALIPGGTNYVRNPYGGLIWIFATVPYAEPIQLTLSGVVKSPDFVYGESDDASWKEEVMQSKVPWLELRASSIVFSVPTERVQNFIRTGRLVSMEDAMREWENVFAKDYYEWMGFETDISAPLIDRKPLSPERMVLDIHPVVGYGHNGSPVVAQDDNGWLSEAVGAQAVREGNVWGTAHEFGHNYQQTAVWSWNGLGETSNNLFSFKIAHRNGINRVGQHPQVRAQFPLAVQAAKERGGADGATLNAGHHAAGNPFYKITPFAQIFAKLRSLDNPSDEEFGWSFMPFLYKRARHVEYTAISDLDKRDFFYEALCDYAKQDMYPFFNAWDIKLSSYSRERMAIKYPRMTTKLWEYQPLDGTGGDAIIDF
ncbi:hypothetical protein G5B30_11380 [Sphingobacterium sp. SGG-5]|uniref:M60 family metallopeptidase n=1 Tax=Sphingobacterium sp. SGG-5 TaxID=2710881 RepID=UPI0013E9CF0D|nr:M60 family metallopeptidase [Sphingobacterium sp. SGG-5]NGM62515.1 hypothetical protein [Sphingobacterium sp. SGG-5]